MSEVAVFVVEDDDQIRETLCEVFEMEGYEVLSAPNGDAAIKRLAGLGPTELPAMILLDMMMPVMDGLTFLDEKRKLPAAAASVPVVAISAAKHPAPKRPDVAEFMQKPMDLGALLAMVAKYCAAK